MSETIKTFYENKHVREAVLDYLINHFEKRAINVSVNKPNEAVGEEVKALRIATVFVNDAFNDMAELTTKKGDKPKPNDAL